MKQFRIVGGLDFSAASEKKTLAEARARARPILRQWLRRIELAVMAGELSSLDYILAREMTNYPSANEGRCYAGQKRLGAAVGSCARTARRSLQRLRDRQFVFCKRGGPGRTASWTFCVNGTPIFDSVAFLPAKSPPFEKSKVSAQERTHVSALDRTHVSAKPFEPNPIEHKPSPPSPPHQLCGSKEPPTEASAGAVLDGEIINRAISFQEFWLAAGRYGSEGFARAEWRKLSAADVAAISDRFQRDGRLTISNVWAGTWLRDRVWEEPPPAESDLYVSPVYDQVHAPPGSDLWRAERERLRAGGHSMIVKFMDDRAAAGEGWTVRISRNRNDES